MFTIPVDLFSPFINGMNAAEDLQSKRAKNYADILQNRFDSQAYNNAIYNNQLTTAMNESNVASGVGQNNLRNLNNAFNYTNLNNNATAMLNTNTLNGNVNEQTAAYTYGRLPTYLANKTFLDDASNTLSQYNIINSQKNAIQQPVEEFTVDLQNLGKNIEMAISQGNKSLATQYAQAFMVKYPNHPIENIQQLLSNDFKNNKLDMLNNFYNPLNTQVQPSALPSQVPTTSVFNPFNTRMPPNNFGKQVTQNPPIASVSPFNPRVQLPRVGGGNFNALPSTSQAYENATPLPKNPFKNINGISTVTPSLRK